MTPSNNLKYSRIGINQREMKCVPKENDQYKMKRAKNNAAVKKSREKTKGSTQAILDRVEKLKMENFDLVGKIETLNKELELLRQLFIEHAGDSHNKQLTNREMQLLKQGVDFDEDFDDSDSNSM